MPISMLYLVKVKKLHNWLIVELMRLFQKELLSQVVRMMRFSSAYRRMFISA